MTYLECIKRKQNTFLIGQSKFSLGGAPFLKARNKKIIKELKIDDFFVNIWIFGKDCIIS